jgi:hypothetical protein
MKAAGLQSDLPTELPPFELPADSRWTDTGLDILMSGCNPVAIQLPPDSDVFDLDLGRP